MKTNSKLYHLTDPTFELPLYVDTKQRVVTQEAANIPTLFWPDGSWCLPGNVYMLELYHSGFSRKYRGGTLLTYATNISHLLRYVHQNNIQLKDLTDNEFSLFIRFLQGEKRESNPEIFARNSNSVIAIGRNCLEFLACYGRLYKYDDYIGPNGQIYAEHKEFEVKQTKRGQPKIIKRYWHHRSFPVADPTKRRLPISAANIEKLRQVIQEASLTSTLKKRRYVMLKLLEITGGRRSEVVEIDCNSVISASKMIHPTLKLITNKKRDGKTEFREMPISRHDVSFLMEYIDINRKHVIRLTCGNKDDDGYLLVSETTGKGLKPNTITQELSYLAKLAGIKEKTCPHMFRHRFITKLFVSLIEQHKFDNTDSFRRALLDIESLKQKVMQWTGHSRMESLDIYINLAFDEIANFTKTYNIVHAKQVVNSFQSTINQLQNELSNGRSPADILLQLENLTNALQLDLDVCLENINSASFQNELSSIRRS